MKEFDVTITETLKLTVSVEASSKEEARQMVSDQWHAGDHILDADNFVEVEFESNDGKEISAERAQNDTIEVLMMKPSGFLPSYGTLFLPGAKKKALRWPVPCSAGQRRALNHTAWGTIRNEPACGSHTIEA